MFLLFLCMHYRNVSNQGGRLRRQPKSRCILAGFEFILSLSKDPAPARKGRGYTSNFINIQLCNERSQKYKKGYGCG